MGSGIQGLAVGGICDGPHFLQCIFARRRRLRNVPEADAPLRSVCHAMWAMLRAAVGTATDQPATQKSVPARLPERKLSECELLHITPVRAALDHTNGPERQLIFDKY